MSYSRPQPKSIWCKDCYLHFASQRDFNAHRVRSYLWKFSCIDMVEMIAKGMVADTQGLWMAKR